jgi:hypothetical protein
MKVRNCAVIGIFAMLAFFAACDTGTTPKSSTFTSIKAVSDYLSTEKGTLESPVELSVKMDMGITEEAGSNWIRLLTAIFLSNAYVSLDLSACTLNGTSFIGGTMVGRDQIVSLILPDTAETIGNFRYFLNLKKISGKNVKGINADTFYYYFSEERLALTKADFPNLETIGNNAFTNCVNLVEASYPKLISGVGGFYECIKLETLDLPESCVAFGTFANCTNLKKVIVRRYDDDATPTITNLNANAFNGINPDLVVLVPPEAVDEYKAATNWSLAADRIKAIGSEM